MQANENGLAFTKAELRALREFSSKEETDRNRFGVQIEIKGDRCFARATDGMRCLELDGQSDGTHGDGEWFVAQKFLIDGRKLLEGKQVLRLRFAGASLRKATVEENGVTRETISSEDDMAIAQYSFPQIAKTLKLPSKTREKLHCVALAAGHMKAVQLAAECVEEEMVDFFPPSDPDGLLIFRVGDEKSTSVMGAIKANASAASILRKGEDDSDDDDESDDEDKPKKSRAKKNPRQQEMPGTASPAE